MFAVQARLQPRHHYLSSCDSGITVSHMESQNRPIKTASVVDHGIPSAFFEMLFSGERGIFLSRGRLFGWRKHSLPKKFKRVEVAAREAGMTAEKTKQQTESRAVLSTLCRSETLSCNTLPFGKLAQKV